MRRRLIRRTLLPLCFTTLVLAGCQDATAPLLAPAQPPLAQKSTDPGPSAIEIKITDFDLETLTVTGFNKHGNVYSGTLSTSTTYSAAVISRFIPGDPCRDIAIIYNGAVLSGEAPIGRIDEMRFAACNAKVWISAAGVIRTFQPMP